MNKEMLFEVVCLIYIFFNNTCYDHIFCFEGAQDIFEIYSVLNHTMMLYVHKDRTDEISTEPVAEQFIMAKEWRRHYFGNM